MMNHSPTCPQPPPLVSVGFSMTLWRCPECRAIETLRHGAKPQPIEVAS